MKQGRPLKSLQRLYPQYEEAVGQAGQLVDVFSGILGRPIQLLTSYTGESKTDGAVIRVDADSPDFYLRVESNLAHLVFQSNPEACRIFLADYAEQALKHLPEGQHAAVSSWTIRKALRQVVELLDHLRVIHLWGAIYRGSSEALFEIYQQETWSMLETNAPLPAVMACHWAGQTPEVDAYEAACLPLFDRALERVRSRDYLAVLLATKQLISEMVSTYAEVAEVGKAEAFVAVIELLGAATGNSSVTAPVAESSRVGDPQLALQMAEAASKTSVRDPAALDSVLEHSEERMREVVEATLEAITPPYSVKPLGQLSSEVHMREIREIEENPILDSSAVHRLRQVFLRMMSRSKNTLEDFGTEIDTLSVIERHVSRRPIPVFLSSVSGRGFRCMVLVDRSASMLGLKLKLAESACNTLRKALDYPFVTAEVWGFQGYKDTSTLITQFPPGTTLSSRKTPPNGGTPLPIALRVSVSHLKPGNEYKHLFVLTDGAPCSGDRDQDDLIRETGEIVSKARRSGIGVSALIITEPEEEGVEDEDLQTMFGSGWRRADHDHTHTALVTLVTRTFGRYLVRR